MEFQTVIALAVLTIVSAVGVMAFAACIAAWFWLWRKSTVEAQPVDEVTAQMEARIAEVHRQAREKMATTVLGTNSDQFEDMLRGASNGPR